MEAVEDDTRMQPQGKPIFHLEVGVTWILFTLLPRCYDPIIQRKILTIMPQGLVQGGLWSSAFTSRIGERILAMKEAEIENSFTVSDLGETVGIRVKGVSSNPENSHVSVVLN